MNDRFRSAAGWVLIALMAAASAWALSALPSGAQVAVHFDAQGQPDGWGDARWVLALLPLLALLMQGLRRVLPGIDPRGANLVRSAAAYGTIWLAVTALLAAVHGLLVAHALGWIASLGALPVVLVGVLFVVLGNVMGKLRWNYTVGIRTPWTLADERVWDQTHRFGGRLMVAVGALLIVLAWVPGLGDWRAPALVGLVCGLVAAVMVKSWLLWRRRRAELESAAG